ncbi:restriction endonuclease subunit S [Aeromonas caviae]
MIEQLITDHLDLWSSAVRPKSSAGRGSNSKLELTGIKKLRELILELAVRGKLVPQDPNDEPASVLLERIAAEKARLVKEGKLKKSKPLPEITEEEIPFELPEGWMWCRVGSITNASTGYAFKSSQYVDTGTFVLRVTNINPNGTINKDDNKYISPESADNEFENFKLSDGDVLLVMVGGSLGKLGVVCEAVLPAVLNQNMWKLDRFCGMPIRYFLFVLQYINNNEITVTSSTHGHLAQGDYMEKMCPLAPLNQQHRIVAKVDELMSLCDQLEQQSEASLAAHQTLVETLLTTLTESADSSDLAQNWARLAQYFDSLFTTQSSIDALKQTILQLAVMGKLVPQDPSDEPASVLLERIAAEKARLVKEGKIKKEKPLPPISEEEKLFRIPDSWCFCRLGDICDGITSGSTPPKEKFSHDEGVPFLKVYNIRDQKIDFDYEPQFVEKDYNDSKLKRSMLYPGDVVMNIVGPPLGKVAIIPSNFPVWNCNQAIVFFRPIDMGLNKHIYTYLKAGLFLASIELIGTAGQDNISVTKSRLIVLPMPPLKEQLRIADRIEQLLSLCDQLSARLQASQTTQLNLAEALVEGALN